VVPPVSGWSVVAAPRCKHATFDDLAGFAADFERADDARALAAGELRRSLPFSTRQPQSAFVLQRARRRTARRAPTTSYQPSACTHHSPNFAEGILIWRMLCFGLVMTWPAAAAAEGLTLETR